MATQTIHPPDLRHVTSNSDLLAPAPIHSHREAAHRDHHGCRGRPSKLATGPTAQHATPSKLGTRSPSEIPSSPSSVHSSNSAIFERDIEPLPAALMSTVESINSHSPPSANPQFGSATHHHHTLNPQVIENAVPAVLDSAIAALTEEPNKTTNDPAMMNIAVISPASPSSHNSGAWTPTGIGSPTGLRTVNISRGASISKPRHISGPSGPSSVVGGSRSPSPTRRSFSVNFPAGIVPAGAGQPSASPGSQSPRIVSEPQRSNSLSTPPIPGAFGGPGSPPTSASSANVSPSMSPMSNIMGLAQDGTASPVVEVMNQSPPLSQGGLSPLMSQSSKRLSFVSYSDILNSAPLSAVPLSTIITSDELPPHIPAVIGPTVDNVPGSGSSVVGSEGGEWLGGEYEREGFGRGLEARLEAVLSKEGELNGHTALSSVSEPGEDAAIGIAH